LVKNANGDLDGKELKGFWTEHAGVKIKVTASLYPFRFVAVQYKKKQWVFEEIPNR